MAGRQPASDRLKDRNHAEDLFRVLDTKPIHKNNQVYCPAGRSQCVFTTSPNGYARRVRDIGSGIV